MSQHKISPNKQSIGIPGIYREFPFPICSRPIANDYEILQESLGRGTNGKIVTCIHRKTKRKCALKVLKDSEKARREVILHKKAAEGCGFIVQILDVYENLYSMKQCLLIVMECMEGGQLFDHIRNDQEKPYTERKAANLILMMAKAVAHLHHLDIAHRDLKLENLLFTSTADDAILKLTDFGFAKEGHNKERPLNTPCNTCTPIYEAPEILSNDKYDKACDIWSMGVIMYMLLSGDPPFFAAHDGPLNAGLKTKIKAGEYRFPEAKWGNISQEAKSIIQKMLTVNPATRLTIDEILQNPWFTGATTETSIDIGPILDAENYEHIRAEIAAAIHTQRRTDDEDELQLNLLSAGNSRIAQRAAERQRQATLGKSSDAFNTN